MRTLWISLAAAAVVLSVVVGPVAARSREVVEQRSRTPLLFGGLDTCLADYGFTITGEYLRIRTVTLVYEGDTLVREILNIHFDGRETNDSDPSQWLVVNGERRLVFDYVAGTFTETGTLRHITAAGSGIILQQVGRSVSSLETGESIQLAGPHDLSSGNVVAYCEALAG